MITIEALGFGSLMFSVVFTAIAYSESGNPRAAIIEAWLNILIGFSINYLANLVLLPMLDAKPHIGLAENWWMGWIYTAISMMRQYTIRLYLANKIHNAAVLMAGGTTRKESA